MMQAAGAHHIDEALPEAEGVAEQGAGPCQRRLHMRHELHVPVHGLGTHAAADGSGQRCSQRVGRRAGRGRTEDGQEERTEGGQGGAEEGE